MDLDDFAKGAAASLLTDQVNARTGLAYKVAGAFVVLALIGVLLIDGWLRWLTMLVLLAGLAALAIVFLAKRLATSLIGRLASPVDLADSRQYFNAAIAEADLPTGPIGLLRLIWRLRKGVGPEVKRLGEVISRLKSELE